MIPYDQAIERLQQLRAARKFDPNPLTFYPGLPDERLREPLTNLVNESIDTFIAVAQNKGKETDYLHAIQECLEQFDDDIDSEEKDRICDYFEDMMDAVGLESSEGILEVWRYGVDLGFPYLEG